MISPGETMVFVPLCIIVGALVSIAGYLARIAKALEQKNKGENA